jgi:hypothetical protein
MGSVEWITPSTLAIPMMQYNTRIKHVAHLVLGVSKINHRLINHLKEPKNSLKGLSV